MSSLANERPERVQEVNQAIQWTEDLPRDSIRGPRHYDFVNIVEASTNEVIARISVERGSGGTVQLTTIAATNIDAFVQMIRKSGSPWPPNSAYHTGIPLAADSVGE
jgi:uncharacterized protein with GYD domain